METSLKLQETLMLPSPNTSTSSSTTSNGTHLPTTPTPQQPITRPETNNPYPTTFVQADTSSFKHVVQMLTGSSDTAKRVDPHKNPIPPIKTNPKYNSSNNKSSKLYERRNSLKSFKISPLLPGLASHPGRVGSPRIPGTPEILSPSMLNFPSLALSPVTPLIPDPFNRSPTGSGTIDMEAENKAIGNKGFYLHPSPSNTPRNGSEPRLLPLFPVTSPRVAAAVEK